MDVVTIKRKGLATETTLLAQVWLARSFWQRLRGLLGKPALRESQGLLIYPCRQIHTVGMSYPLDIIFPDRDGTVLKLCPAVKPFRQAFAAEARYTLELAAGVAGNLKLKIGDQLSW